MSQNKSEFKFRTEYNPKPSDLLLDPEQPIILIGSCFSDYIGQRMRFSRWRAYPNIGGTLYNPASIANILRIVVSNYNDTEVINDSLAEKDNLWISWLTDSGCTTYSKEDTINLLSDRIQKLRNYLKETRTLIVTFGTSRIYELSNRKGYIVSNCHKFPSDKFISRRLSVTEIVEDWNELIHQLTSSFPELRILFTVSPVRHLKDGFEENTRSKAVLQLACEDLCNLHENVDYFPAFEIMNDDLRDYRFYSADMAHPSPEAVEYIWQKFQLRYLSSQSRALLAQGEKVTKRLNHRPNLYGDNRMATYLASRNEYEARKIYDDFINAHPNMLAIDDSEVEFSSIY